MKILHINCNYVNSSLHQLMIDDLNRYCINFTFCPVLNGKNIKNVSNEHTLISECFSCTDRILYFRKQSKIKKEVIRNYDMTKFDMIHAYTLFTDGNCAMELSKKYGIPFVVTIRDTDINDFLKFKPYMIYRGIKIMEMASKIFFLSNSYKKLMLNKYIHYNKKAFLENKMVVIPNGIDDFWLKHKCNKQMDNDTTERLRKKRIQIICVAQIIKRKNIPFIQKAINVLNSEGWNIHLNIIGKIKSRTEYNIVKSNLNTTCFPPVSKEDLINLYRNNDILILASHTETFGLVYAEAISQGLPVIYTRGQGFDEQFPEGVIGYSTSDYDINDLIGKIKKIVNEYSKYNNISKYSEKFKWSHIAKQYSNIYAEILK